MELKEAIEKRRCVRKFKLKSCSPHDILTICESALKAPCAGGLFSLKLIIVDDKEMKGKLAEAALEQDFMNEASHIIVVCSERKQTERSYGKYASAYLRQQAGAAIENMFLRAVDMGLSACWVGAFNEDAIKRLLKVPEDVDVEALLPIGYGAEKPEEKSKPELRMVVRLGDYVTKTGPVKKKIHS